MRWVHAKSTCTISWTVQPQKKSINFGLFKHPGALASLPTVAGLPPLSATSSRTEENPDEVIPEVVEKLANIGLKQVVKLAKYEGDKFSQGRYEVPAGEGGHYALVFDNTFSKSISKNVTFFLLTYPTNCQSSISFGAQMHHTSAMSSVMSMAPPITTKKSPKTGPKDKQSVDSLKLAATATGDSTPLATPTLGPTIEPEKTLTHTGVLQKRRRKKHQGYARRYFSLDYTSSTLSYYHDRNSSALRGAIPLSLAAIGANAKTREISIDSGAEIWHLKANNQQDFDQWKVALEEATKLAVDSLDNNNDLSSPADGFAMTNQTGELQLQRLETLLSQISGTRDAVRRLYQATLNTPNGPHSPQFDGATSTPPEGSSDNYFPDEVRRAFWKRKPSNTASSSNIFRRSASNQLTIPIPGALPLSPGLRREETMHDHMKALMSNLDSVIGEFSSLITENRQRIRPQMSQSAVSRLSMQSVESREYFDADDGLVHTDSHLLSIPDDEAESGENDSKESADSDTSSDIGDDEAKIEGRPFRTGSLTSLLPPQAKSLSPLPLQPVHRRDTIMAPTIMPPSLIGFLRKNVGKDLSTISMPVSANEPTSLLQRCAENLEYSELLDSAAKSDNPQERLLYVTAFAISAFSTLRVKERSIRKPFNPMLGETYELVREDKNFRFIAEKVSHRPVQLAYHAEGSDWALSQSPLPSQKFWGKSSEIITEGKARVILHSSGDCISWTPATSFLRNIIAGEKYVEPVGTMTVVNETTGYRASVSFKGKGMFSGRSEEVDVQLVDEHGHQLPLGLVGTWTNNLVIKENGRADARRQIWSVGSLVDRPEKHYGMTSFAATLNQVTDIENDKLPPTDSRLRKDQTALENGQYDEAETLKNSIEEGQRKRRREMEAAGTSWTPKFFMSVRANSGDEEKIWKLKAGKEDGYWERRARGDWSDIVDVLATE